MSATIAPSEFVAVGADVAVIWTDRNGKPIRYRRAAVATVGAQHFTVTDVVTPGAQPRPVRFRNRIGRDAAHEATGDMNMYVIEDGTEIVAKLRGEIRARRTENAMRTAVKKWSDMDRRRNDYGDGKPSATDIDTALHELIFAATNLRAMLGGTS